MVFSGKRREKPRGRFSVIEERVRLCGTSNVRKKWRKADKNPYTLLTRDALFQRRHKFARRETRERCESTKKPTSMAISEFRRTKQKQVKVCCGGGRKKRKEERKEFGVKQKDSNNANQMTQPSSRSHRSLGVVSPGARDAFYWLVIQLRNPVELGGISVLITL